MTLPLKDRRVELEIFILENDYTRASFAKKLGISTSYLSLLMDRKRKPGPALSRRIEKVTGGKFKAVHLRGLVPEPTKKPRTRLTEEEL
jgi:transcriptional regulator with XRE-family HTH domain